MTYTASHKAAVLIATIGAIVLLAGILFGNMPMPASVGSHLSVREACLAAWAIAVPAWFTFEEWWTPTDPEYEKTFRRNQQFARYGWLAAGLIIAAIIGTTIPEGRTPPAPGSAEEPV